MKNNLMWLVIIIIIGGGVYFMTRKSANDTIGTTDGTASSSNLAATADTATGDKRESVVIGKSVEGRDITAYNYGTGGTRLLFVGGIHGGYEWNTVLLAYQLMDYLKANPNVIPKNIQVTVIPVLNPDGLNKTVGTAGRFTPSQVQSSQTVAGRFNANSVDLSRNFDCDWQAKGVWQSRPVSGGTAVFSEPEALALKNYVTANKPTAAIVWYSSADGVFAASCGGGASADTTRLMSTYAQASGYPAFDEFTAYKVTGDAVNWLAKENIPAISVLLVNHTDTDWDKNLAGVNALLNLYTK